MAHALNSLETAQKNRQPHIHVTDGFPYPNQ